jgi:hypothetical protein
VNSCCCCCCCCCEFNDVNPIPCRDGAGFFIVLPLLLARVLLSSPASEALKQTSFKSIILMSMQEWINE